jgi:hypothetical protein
MIRQQEKLSLTPEGQTLAEQNEPSFVPGPASGVCAHLVMQSESAHLQKNLGAKVQARSLSLQGITASGAMGTMPAEGSIV